MNFLADVRFGARMLAKSPAFTLAAVAAMSLGIGANSMMFTIYNAALFKSLPFERADEVVHVHTRNLEEAWDERGFFYEDFLAFRERATLFKGLEAFMGNGYRLTDGGGIVRWVEGCMVTPGLFSLLGKRPLIGRDFQASDGQPGAPPVVILSYGLWQSAFFGDAATVGRHVRLSGAVADGSLPQWQVRTIIGVMPGGFQFPRQSQLFIPVVDTQHDRDAWYNRYGYLVGRLKDPTGLRGAETELRGIARQIGASRPPHLKGIEPVVLPYAEWDIRGRHRVMAMATMGAVTFVLLIACTNVANLLLSRAGQRVREVAIRIALGATRLRIASQLLIESILLSFLGGAFGLILALVLVRLFVLAIQPLGVPYWIDWSMDARSLVYLFAACVASGIFFGLAPALQISAIKVSEGLQETGRQSKGGGRAGVLASGLVVAEISLTLALMVGAGLMIRSLIAMQGVDLGLDRRNLLALNLGLWDQYPQDAQRTRLVDRLFEGLAAHPEIESFTVASAIPAGGAWLSKLTIEGRDGPGSEPLRIAEVRVGDGYFQALGLTMVSGREFKETDSLRGVGSVVVNERFASQYFPGTDPLGKRIKVDRGPYRTIVGVAPSIRQTSLRGAREPVIYLPFREGPPYHFHILVRARSNSDSVAKGLREEVRRLDPELTMPDIRTLDATIDRLSLETRILGALFSVFAAIGLFLSTLGIYAVTAYATSRRTREIGIRIALGATRADIARLVLQSGVRQLALALPIGLGAALALSRVFETVLFEVTPLDPVTFVAIPIGLSVITLGACLIPAQRASRLDPVEALRTE